MTRLHLLLESGAELRMHAEHLSHYLAHTRGGTQVYLRSGASYHVRERPEDIDAALDRHSEHVTCPDCGAPIRVEEPRLSAHVDRGKAALDHLREKRDREAAHA